MITFFKILHSFKNSIGSDQDPQNESILIMKLHFWSILDWLKIRSSYNVNNLQSTPCALIEACALIKLFMVISSYKVVYGINKWTLPFSEVDLSLPSVSVLWLRIPSTRSLCQIKVCSENRGSYMSAHVLLNLLNELGKRDKFTLS